MAASGYDWGAFTDAEISSVDWDGTTVADSASLTSDAISLDTKAGCEVGLEIVEDNTGAISGDVTVYVLGACSSVPNYEELTNSGAWSFTITPVQNDTVWKRFNIDPKMYGSCKIALENDSGQTLETTVSYRTADWPAAS